MCRRLPTPPASFFRSPHPPFSFRWVLLFPLSLHPLCLSPLLEPLPFSPALFSPPPCHRSQPTYLGFRLNLFPPPDPSSFPPPPYYCCNPSPGWDLFLFPWPPAVPFLLFHLRPSHFHPSLFRSPLPLHPLRSPRLSPALLFCRLSHWKAGFGNHPAPPPHPSAPLSPPTSLPSPCLFPVAHPSLSQISHPSYFCPSSCLSNLFYPLRAAGVAVEVFSALPAIEASLRRGHPASPPHLLLPTHPPPYFATGLADLLFLGSTDSTCRSHQAVVQNAGFPPPSPHSPGQVFWRSLPFWLRLAIVPPINPLLAQLKFRPSQRRHFPP